jgi:MFS family permease
VSDELTVTPSAGLLSPEYRLVTIAILLIVSLAAFDALSVYAALPPIGGDLGHVALLPWVMTSFLLASAIAILASGPLIDGLGPRATFRFAVLIFFVSSAACAVSPSMWVLIVARFAQGMGGGISVAVGLASIGLTYPERLHARAFAAESLVWSLVGVGGPPIVALLVATIGWRGVFVVNLPLTAIAGVFGWSRVPTLADSATRRVALDRSGIVIVAVFTSALLVGLSHLGWSTLVYLAVAAATLVVYRGHIRNRATLVVEGRHLWRLPLGALNLTVLLSLAAGLGVESFLPVYTRGAQGRSEAVAAFVVAFITIGWTVGSVSVSRALDHIDAIDVVFWTTAALAPSLALTGLAVVYTDSLVAIGAGYFLAGLCIGALTTSALTSLQTYGSSEELGRINAAHQYMRTVGISAGIALSSGIVLFIVGQRVGDVESVRQLLAGDEVSLDDRAAESIRSGYGWAHAVGAALAVAALVPAWYLRRVSRLVRPGDVR